MRDIRFRAWDKTDKVMIDSDSLAFEEYAPISLLFSDAQRTFEIMQYTGLKDKNGKEIYEGDIVQCIYDGTENNYVVIFDESELDFKATNGKENYGNYFQYLKCCDEVEIIGNIYENPKLLEMESSYDR